MSSGAYERDINRTELLTPEREAELAELIQAGRRQAAASRHGVRARRIIAAGKRAEAEYIEANLRLVLSVVSRLKRPLPMDRDDLIQEGSLGLMHALEKFDWGRGVKFSTYAYTWIKNYISRAITNQSRLIRIPIDVDEDVRRVVRMRDRLDVKLGRTATDHEVAAALDLTVQQVRQLELYNQPPASLSVDDGNIDVPVSVSEIEGSEPEPQHPAVAELLDALSRKERPVMSMLYGLEGGAQLTRLEAARQLGCCETTVQRIQRSALRKLREAA